jgi:hypothetical protein
MKNLVLAVSVVTIGTAGVGGQPTPTPPAATTTNAIGPRIQFATPVYDFGRVRAGEPVKYTYVFTNTGDRLLVINSVQPGCGCTTAGDWTRQVEPGKTGNIPIQFNTAGQPNQVFKQVTVNCNIANQPPIVMLQFKGSIYKPFDITPPLAIMNVPPDVDEASVVISITNNTPEPLILLSAESINRRFTVQLITNLVGKAYKLKVATVPPVSLGSAQGQIALKTTWTNTPTISVTVVANVQPAVMVIPSYVTLPPGPLPYPMTNSVMIQNNSTNPLVLSDPVVNVPGVGTEIKETVPGKTFSAKIEFPQGFQAPPGQQMELNVKSSHPRYPMLKVIVMQLPRPPAATLPHPPTPLLPAPPAPAMAPTRPAQVAAPVPPVKRVSTAAGKTNSELPPLPPGF